MEWIFVVLYLIIGLIAAAPILKMNDYFGEEKNAEERFLNRMGGGLLVTLVTFVWPVLAIGWLYSKIVKLFWRDQK